MKRNKQVLWAMTELGDDLIDAAQRYRPKKTIWRHLLPVAACLAVVLGLWQAGKQPVRIPAEFVPPVTESVQEIVPQEVSADPAKAVHILDVSSTTPRMVAVDEEGTVVAEAERLEFITDRATGERLAILATTVWGADSDWKSTERIVYDLFGTELHRIKARQIQCVGDVAAVTYHAENVSLYHRDGTVLQENLSWAVAYRDCMAVGSAGEERTQQYYGPDGTLMVDSAVDDLNRFDTYYGERTLFYKRSGDSVGLVDLHGNWVIEPKYAEYDFVNDTCVRCKDAVGSWVLVSLETGEVLYRMGPEKRYVEPRGGFLFCMGDAGSWWEDRRGTVIVPPAPQVQAVDDGDDGNLDLFFAQDLKGETIYYETDGTERLRVSGIPKLETLSSRTAAGIRETGDGQTELRLVDLSTGEERGGFSKAYLDVDRMFAYGEDKELLSGCFYAWYRGEDGSVYADLMDENGNILLEQLLETREGTQPHIGGGVFRVEGGYRHLDGTWLYRE